MMRVAHTVASCMRVDNPARCDQPCNASHSCISTYVQSAWACTKRAGRQGSPAHEGLTMREATSDTGVF
eukprot:363411-Chlamydomonas_euryale.AAC.11